VINLVSVPLLGHFLVSGACCAKARPYKPRETQGGRSEIKLSVFRMLLAVVFGVLSFRAFLLEII
jgi:hypothetical protein